MNQHLVHVGTAWEWKGRVGVNAVLPEFDVVEGGVDAGAEDEDEGLGEEDLVNLQIFLFLAHLLAHIKKSLRHSVEKGAGQAQDDSLLPTAPPVALADLGLSLGADEAVVAERADLLVEVYFFVLVVFVDVGGVVVGAVQEGLHGEGVCWWLLVGKSGVWHY